MEPVLPSAVPGASRESSGAGPPARASLFASDAVSVPPPGPLVVTYAPPPPATSTAAATEATTSGERRWSGLRCVLSVLLTASLLVSCLLLRRARMGRSGGAHGSL